MRNILCAIFGHQFVKLISYHSNYQTNYQSQYLGCIRCRKIFPFDNNIKTHIVMGKSAFDKMEKT